MDEKARVQDSAFGQGGKGLLQEGGEGGQAPERRRGDVEEGDGVGRERLKEVGEQDSVDLEDVTLLLVQVTACFLDVY